MSTSSTKTQITIERLSHEGRGIGYINGKTTFVWGALAGETVNIRYTRRRNSYDEAIAEEIIQAAAERVSPVCAHFGVCGGCSLQHIEVATQIKHKQKVLLELLEHQANAQPQNLLAPLTAKSFGYRRKARIGIKYVPKKNKVLVGFRERDGRFIADLNSCAVLEPKLGQLFDELSQLIYKLAIRDQIAQLETAITDDTTAIIIRHLAPFNPEDLTTLINFAKQHQLQLYLQPKGLDSIHLLYPETSTELLAYRLKDYDLHMEFHPAQFTQVNFEINALMIKQALSLLDLQATDSVLDLFCGIGNFSLPIARHAAKVIGVEGDVSAVKQAQANAALNNIHNAEFYTSNLFENISGQAWAQQNFTKILLDPPRAGAQEIIEQFKIWQPERIVYISCNPATLARDTQLLLKQGYKLNSTGVMDMFPHTQHVEAMSLFCKN
ncbi:MAG TPA: 23S rRNA (uracil(1939)-C(5))-methyltransferase RlmD [Coxiellaceae bacterium]|nr:23S rRNA (uracil(1939)-C(5))-methyltransferase RlmD [Coxiellaceae bacterium]